MLRSTKHARPRSNFRTESRILSHNQTESIISESGCSDVLSNSGKSSRSARTLRHKYRLNILIKLKCNQSKHFFKIQGNIHFPN